MKSILLLSLIFMASQQFTYGQKTELNLNAYSGLFSFRGDGATSTSHIFLNGYSIPGDFTSNPYGNKNDFSYSIELQGQRITKSNHIYGIGISYEALTSKVRIDTVTVNGFIYYQYSVDGKSSLKNTFITLNPYAGHRFFYRKIKFDFLVGLDLGFCLISKETGNAIEPNGIHVSVENEKVKPSIDFRPRIQLKTQLNKFGLILGYSLGLTDYQTQLATNAYSSYFRIGLSFQLK